MPLKRISYSEYDSNKIKQNQTKKGKTQGLFFDKILSTNLRREKQCKKNQGSASKNNTKSLRKPKKTFKSGKSIKKTFWKKRKNKEKHENLETSVANLPRNHNNQPRK